MKNKTRHLAITLCWLLCSTVVIGQDDKETTAIKAVIERETAAYFQTDYKGWMDCWVHAPYSYWCVADSTGFNTFEGWKAIEIGFTDYFVTSKPSTTTFARKWNSIRIYGTGAYANFVQLTTLDGVTVAEDELRVLEKQNNKWKIVLVMVGHKKGN